MHRANRVYTATLLAVTTWTKTLTPSPAPNALTPDDRAARPVHDPLGHPVPKMCQVYRLLGLIRRHGPDRVEAACSQALDQAPRSSKIAGRFGTAVSEIIERLRAGQPYQTSSLEQIVSRWQRRCAA